jgi:6-pyruvoyltetrahydropterin/6-carboxytetrahydropterin synthase
MYSIGIKKEFIARHYLTGGDWGSENLEHSHYYRVEIEIRGRSLDNHGYLVDFVDLDACVDSLVDRYRESILNDLPEFSGLNPSVEHLARIFCTRLSSSLFISNILATKITIWEKSGVWASYEEERG